MIYSLVKRDFSNMRHLIQSSISVSTSEYEKAVKKLMNLRLSKDFREGFPMSMLRGVLEHCEDKDFKLDMLNRVENIVLADIEGDEISFRELSAITNIYFYFEQDIYYVTDGRHFWPIPLGDTQFCEHLLLPYLNIDYFLNE